MKVLYRVALAILQMNSSYLMKCNDTTEFMRCLGERMKSTNDANKLLQVSTKIDMFNISIFARIDCYWIR